MYGLVKKVIQIFVPEIASTQVWFYVDMFLPFLLPTIPITRRGQSFNKMPFNKRPFLFNKGRLAETPEDMTISDLMDHYNGTIDLTVSLVNGSKLAFLNETNNLNTTFYNSTVIKHLMKRAIDQYMENFSDEIKENNTSDDLGFDFGKLFQSPDFNLGALAGLSQKADSEESPNLFENITDSRGNKN